jgi:hypothetical protein
MVSSDTSAFFSEVSWSFAISFSLLSVLSVGTVVVALRSLLMSRDLLALLRGLSFTTSFSAALVLSVLALNFFRRAPDRVGVAVGIFAVFASSAIADSAFAFAFAAASALAAASAAFAARTRFLRTARRKD